MYLCITSGMRDCRTRKLYLALVFKPSFKFSQALCGCRCWTLGAICRLDFSSGPPAPQKSTWRLIINYKSLADSLGLLLSSSHFDPHFLPRLYHMLVAFSTWHVHLLFSLWSLETLLLHPCALLLLASCPALGQLALY